MLDLDYEPLRRWTLSRERPSEAQFRPNGDGGEPTELANSLPEGPVADVHLTCIRKSRTDSPHEHSTHVGSNGNVWTRQQVIGWIDRKEHSFYTRVADRRADVGVVREGSKAPYLRTHADGQYNNNLLALPAKSMM